MGPSEPSIPSSSRLTLVFPSFLPYLLSPMLPRSSLTKGIVPWLGALIVELRSIMGLMMSAEEEPQISQGTSGGGQTGEKTLNYERLSCPYSGRGKKEDNASGNMCFHNIIIQTHTYYACTSGIQTARKKEKK